MGWFLWIILVYGIVLVVTYSNLLDWYRTFYLRKAGYPKVGDKYIQTEPNPPKSMLLIHRLIFKLINCWLCCAFWSGVVLYYLDLSWFNNPLVSGFTAVGGVGIIKLFHKENK